MQLIVEQGNDYLVGVKGNQPKLLQQFVQASQHQSPRSIDIQTERTRDRLVERTVKVFEANCALTSDWAKAQSLIEVQRRGTRAGEPFDCISYYLSSLSVEAVEFALIAFAAIAILKMGCIGSKMSSSKKMPLTHAHPTAATNWSIIRTIVLNLIRHWGYRSLSKAQRFREP